ncbi:TPA: hypothetical protein MIP51_23430 [Klebsiella pneumoniae]|nr:hypothetical protein [Klebsiella pneumoniae]
MYHARQTMLNVEESDRLSFLPDLFGNDFLAGEMQVYALAEKHITDYCGGFWHFIRIPEGGGYMTPRLRSETARSVGSVPGFADRCGRAKILAGFACR